MVVVLWLLKIFYYQLALRDMNRLQDGLHWLQSPESYADLFAVEQGWFEQKQRTYPSQANADLRNKLIMQPEQSNHCWMKLFKADWCHLLGVAPLLMKL